MSSKLFAFNMASAMQPTASVQNDETTYNVNEQVWVGGNDVTAEGDLFCSFATGLVPQSCVAFSGGCIEGPTSIFPSIGLRCDTPD